jgi:hypothetical protein
MKKWVLALLCCGLVLTQSDIMARSSSSSFSRSSSSFSSSRSSGSGSVFSKSASTKSTSTFSAPSANAPAKPVAVANTKLSNQMARQDAMGAKKYTSQASATSAFRQQQASKYSNSFASEPSRRPDYIPGNISRGGVQYNVVFHGGCYGYYVGGVWSPLDMAAYMVVTDAMLNNGGYGYGPQVYQQPYQGPIIYHHVGRTILIILGVMCVIGLGIFFISKMVI